MMIGAFVPAGVIIVAAAAALLVCVLLIGDGRSSVESAEYDEYRGGDDV